jgi:glutaredoxin
MANPHYRSDPDPRTPEPLRPRPSEPSSARATIVVYGADWCEDTRRSLRLLRRLGVPHRYLNIDEDIDALAEAKALNHGNRRTPTIDMGLGGQALVEPDNDTLTGALVEADMLTTDDARERLGVQNVGDLERVLRTTAGAALLVAGAGGPTSTKWPLRIAGAAIALSGLSGWCPVYYAAGVTSLDGPGDRPTETPRDRWLARAPARESAEVPR